MLLIQFVDARPLSYPLSSKRIYYWCIRLRQIELRAGAAARGGRDIQLSWRWHARGLDEKKKTKPVS